MRKRITKDQVAAIKQASLEGISDAEIARELGISKSAVYRILAQAGKAKGKKAKAKEEGPAEEADTDKPSYEELEERYAALKVKFAKAVAHMIENDVITFEF